MAVECYSRFLYVWFIKISDNEIQTTEFNQNII